MERLKVGLAIAEDEKNLSELKRFLVDPWPQIVVFPEYYLDSERLDEACDLVRKSGKWLITGMEDRRDNGKFYQAAVIINPKGEIVGEHRKTSITKFEQERKQDRGDLIKVIDTEIGKIGIAICYELHLPEVTRTLALQGAEIIINPIGTGMWHEHQYQVWTNMAQTRASENGVFVVGCSHYNDAIPVAFAFTPDGTPLVRERSINRLIPVTLDPSKYTFGRNFDQRRPNLYEDLTKM